MPETISPTRRERQVDMNIAIQHWRKLEPAVGNNNKAEALVFWSAFGVAGLVGLVYWCLAAFRSDAEPIIITIMYRFGDTDYLPLIYSLARGQYSEFVDTGSYGAGLLPFPVFSILPYALCIAAFGNIGFIVADAVIPVGYFLLLYSILRSITDRKAMAAAIALAIIPAMYYNSHFPGAWDFRYPRPYVTQLFLLAATLTSIHLFRQLRKNEQNTWLFFGHGMVIGIATSNVYSAVGFGIATAIIFTAFITFDGRWKLVLTAGTCVALGCLLGTVPSIVQALSANADILQRWGLYQHSRYSTLLFVVTGNFIRIGFIALSPSIRDLLPSAIHKTSASERDLTLVLLTMIGGALLAPLGAVALTGTSIQEYHFHTEFSNIVVLGVFLTIAMILLSVKLKIWMVAVATFTLAAIGAPNLWRDAQAAVNKTDQQRVWADGFVAVPNYRKDLAALLRELDGEKYRQAKILGTFDQQLAMLWVTQPYHTLYIPDTFLSLVRDEVIERRTISLSRMVGMTEEEFLQKANQNYFQNRFLTLAKWQANLYYRAAPLDDYTADQLRRVLQTSPWLNSWHLELPQSVQERLRTAYRASQPVGETPDLVILTNEVSYSSLPGPSSPYALVYQNDSFKVFTRK